MAEKFDPYYKWLGIPPKDQPPHHYRLLGIELFEADRDVIDAAANRVMAYLKDLATGDEAAYSQRLLNEIAQARICLLNNKKKAEYDQQLRVRVEAERARDAAAAPAVEPPPEPPPAGFDPAALGIGGYVAAPPVASDSSDVDLESLVGGVRESATTHPSRRSRPGRKPAKAATKSSKRPLVLASVFAGVAVLTLLVAVAFLLTRGKGFGNGGAGTSGGEGGEGGTEGAPVLVLSLPEQERQEIKLFTIDGQVQKLPPQAEYPLSVGSHQLLLQRPGYTDLRERREVTEGMRWQVRPKWQPRIEKRGKGSKLLSTREPAFDTPAAEGFSSGMGHLAGYWPLDGNLEDKSEQAATAQATPAPTFTEGRVGQALELNAGQKLTIDKLLVHKSGEFTLACWLKLAAMPAGDEPIVDGGGASVKVANGIPVVSVGEKGKPAKTSPSGPDLAKYVGAWMHLAITYSATAKQVHCYVNGEHAGAQRVGGGAPATIGPLTIGSLTGAIDELRLFDYRMSAAVIKRLHDGTFRLPGPAPVAAGGEVKCETWYEVVPGLSRAQAEAVTMRDPDETRALPRDLTIMGATGGTEYLARVRGYLFPPEKGPYVFTLECTGEAALFLQEIDSQGETLPQVVSSRRRAQESAPVQLEPGTPYYFELLFQYPSRAGSRVRLTWKTPSSPPKQPILVAKLAGYKEQ